MMGSQRRWQLSGGEIGSDWMMGFEEEGVIHMACHILAESERVGRMRCEERALIPIVLGVGDLEDQKSYISTM